MKHIRTINKANLKETAAKGGCGKCQTCVPCEFRNPSRSRS